jgi:putative transposase
VGGTGSYRFSGVASRLIIHYDSEATKGAFHCGAVGKTGELMEWARILAYITGSVDQELLLRNEYLVAENRILKAQSQGRLRLSDVERARLGEIGHRLGRKALGEVATAAQPDTILAWYRRLVARKFDGSQARRAPGRPPIGRGVAELIVRMAEENRSWGYDRIAGALANLGHEVCDQTVGNVLRRRGIPPASERKRTTTWAEFIRIHLAVLAGTDFFSVEVLTLRGLVTYYVLFFIHLASRRVKIAGITAHPSEHWMKQMARNVTMEGCGALGDSRYLLHDRDTKYAASFLTIIKSGHVKTLRLPARSPNLNAYCERWVRSTKEECLSKLILFGERSLRRAMREYVAHYHAERNHQGKSNVLLFPQAAQTRRDGPIECRERLVRRAPALLPSGSCLNWRVSSAERRKLRVGFYAEPLDC